MKKPTTIVLASYLLYVTGIVHFFIILPSILNQQLLQGLWIGVVLFYVIMLVWFPYQAFQIRKGSKRAKDKAVQMVIITAVVGSVFVAVLGRESLYHWVLLIIALVIDAGILYLLLAKTTKTYLKKK